MENVIDKLLEWQVEMPANMIRTGDLVSIEGGHYTVEDASRSWERHTEGMRIYTRGDNEFFVPFDEVLPVGIGDGSLMDSEGNLLRWFINAYEIDRCYGGPEEGGWWFDAGEIRRSIPCKSFEEAEANVDRVRRAFKSSGKSSSVIYDGGDYSVRIEEQPGKDYPERMPHYE